METQHFSLTEAADAFGISKSYLSEAVRAGKPAKGHNLHEHAVMEDGRVTGFEIPRSIVPDGATHGDSHGDSHGDDPSPGPKEERTNVRSPNERSERGEERENPAGDSVAASVAAGMAAKEAVDLVKATRAPLEEADPDEAARYMAQMKDVLLDVAPILAGTLWAYAHQDSDDVAQLGGALLAAAGVDMLVNGDSSMIVRAVQGKTGPPASPDAGSEPAGEDSPTADDIAGKAMGGDGVPVDLSTSLNLKGSSEAQQ